MESRTVLAGFSVDFGPIFQQKIPKEVRNMLKRVVFLVFLTAQVASATYKNYHGVAVYGDNIWVVAKDTARSNVYYSPDFGSTWFERPIIRYDLYVPLFDVDFIDAYTGWAVGYEGYIYQTYDGGQNWTLQAYGVSKFITRVKFLNEMVGWAACGDAIYARTSSGGNPPPNGWMSGVAIMAMTELYGVAPIDSLTAFVAAGDAVNRGGQGYLAFTSDGGNNWTVLMQDTVFDYFDVYFADAQKGWLVGGLDTEPYTPKLYKTTNGGMAWNEISLPEGVHTLRAITFVDQNEGWAVGEIGTIIHTTDGGETWEVQNSGISTVLFDVEFRDNMRGVAVGDSNVVLITTDGGNTWRRLDPQAAISEEFAPEHSGHRLTVSTASGYMEIRGLHHGDRVVVYDVLGRKVTEKQSTSSIQRVVLPRTGVYLIKVLSRDGITSYKKAIFFR